MKVGDVTMQHREIFHMRIPSAAEHIAIVRHALDAVGEELRLSTDARAAIKLAVSEACDNALRHAKHQQCGARAPGESVVVVCRAKRNALEIDVRNRGNGFHPVTPAEMPPAELLAEHGRGRVLMEMLMDSVQYLSQNGNTIVRMRKAT